MMLATLIFQIMHGHAWTEEAHNALAGVIHVVDQWSAYRIARTASRYGHHDITYNILKTAANKVSSENLYFWLKGVSQICHGEYIISGMLTDREEETMQIKTENGIPKKKNPQIIEKLSMGNMKFQEGMDNIKASATPQSPASTPHTNFQLEYLISEPKHIYDQWILYGF